MQSAIDVLSIWARFVVTRKRSCVESVRCFHSAITAAKEIEVFAILDRSRCQSLSRLIGKSLVDHPVRSRAGLVVKKPFCGCDWEVDRLQSQTRPKGNFEKVGALFVEVVWMSCVASPILKVPKIERVRIVQTFVQIVTSNNDLQKVTSISHLANFWQLLPVLVKFGFNLIQLETIYLYFPTSRT